MHGINKKSELERVFWSMFNAAPHDARVRMVVDLRDMMSSSDTDSFDAIARAHPIVDQHIKRAEAARHSRDAANERCFNMQAKIRTMSGQIRALNQKLERYKREGIKV